MLTTPSMFGVSSTIENAAMSVFSSGRLIVIGEPDRSPSLHDASHSSVTQLLMRLCQSRERLRPRSSYLASIALEPYAGQSEDSTYLVHSPPGKSRKASAAVHVSASANVRGTGAKVKSDRNTFPHPRPATQGLTGVQLASGNASVSPPTTRARCRSGNQ